MLGLGLMTASLTAAALLVLPGTAAACNVCGAICTELPCDYLGPAVCDGGGTVPAETPCNDDTDCGAGGMCLDEFCLLGCTEYADNDPILPFGNQRCDFQEEPRDMLEEIGQGARSTASFCDGVGRVELGAPCTNDSACVPTQMGGQCVNALECDGTGIVPAETACNADFECGVGGMCLGMCDAGGTAPAGTLCNFDSECGGGGRA